MGNGAVERAAGGKNESVGVTWEGALWGLLGVCTNVNATERTCSVLPSICLHILITTRQDLSFPKLGQAINYVQRYNVRLLYICPSGLFGAFLCA